MIQARKSFAHKDAERIIRNYAGNSLTLNRCERIASGLFNVSFDITTSEGEDYILRIAPGDDYPKLYYEKDMMHNEPEVHRLVREKTSVPVPEIYYYDPTLAVIDREYILMEKMPGTPLTELPEVPIREYTEILFQLGRMTRELHAITGDLFGYVRAKSVMQPQDSWRKAFVIMLERILQDCINAGCFEEDEVNILRKVFLDNEKVLEKKGPPVFLHLDIWQQNILAENGRVTGLLDFDRSAWGDVELEFAVLDICGLSKPAFFAGYGEARDTSKAAVKRNALYVIFEYLKYVFSNKTRRNNPSMFEFYKEGVFEIVKRVLVD
jgi:aminoglycoside phosphotransferase (APT) family kinase protein